MLALSLATLLLVTAPQPAQANSSDQKATSVSSLQSTSASSSEQKENAGEAKPGVPVAAPAAPAAQSPVTLEKGSLVSGQATPGAPAELPKTLSPEMQKKIAEMRAKNEPHRQAAIRINEMAGNIHSEKDARALVDAVAEELSNHHHLMWAALTYRRRVARAEYEAVTDPTNLIPDSRIADLWNEYVREIDAPEEALVTQTEVQNMRRGRYRMSQVMWRQENARSIWNMPNVHAMNSDGTVADGGRPLEMLDILNNLYTQFSGVLFARDRRREQAAKGEVPVALKQPLPQSRVQILVMPQDPIHPAEDRYVKAHGEESYNDLVRRLFDELFPPE